ncbi:MAG: GNAT family N-acetyltransferase [Candidatus Auribacterota bacterium]|jgi:GNAT superfamily N-acetyltransferase|nr:GNAT family N-acetyltransferase [Candidatus Auribacterota bacterium]
MDTSINIEKLQKSDHKDVVAFVNHLMNTEFPGTLHHLEADDLDHLMDAYNGKRDAFLVMKKDGSIIGTVAVKEDSKEVALLRRLFIAKECRNKGYGKMLVQKAIDFCNDKNYQMISFRGNNQMDQAIRVIEKFGFIRKDLIDFGAFHIYIYVKLL